MINLEERNLINSYIMRPLFSKFRDVSFQILFLISFNLYNAENQSLQQFKSTFLTSLTDVSKFTLHNNSIFAAASPILTCVL